MDIKRVFLIVSDSVGIGAMPDAELYGDAGSNTLKSCYDSGNLALPNLSKLGLFNIDGIGYHPAKTSPIGCFARMSEASKGKDTTIGHWEIAGIHSANPLPTYPKGFPLEILDEFIKETGHGILCNKPYSGTAVIADFGEEHMKTGNLIVYTSADSVFQIAAHEDIVPIADLYKYCEIARKILSGKHSVGRVIARPFTGTAPNFQRTSNRHDYSLAPPSLTMCDLLVQAGYDTVGVGKIYDIFAGQGISRSIRTNGNSDGMQKTLALQKEDIHGLIFINLVDFDMLYGHRNDISGYTAALNEFDKQLGVFLNNMRADDLLIITADHGCDPGTPSTDHSREYVPMLAYGEMLRQGVNLGMRASFADIASTVLECFDVDSKTVYGEGFLGEILL